jgi:CheY-like chemotaxis protein
MSQSHEYATHELSQFCFNACLLLVHLGQNRRAFADLSGKIMQSTPLPLATPTAPQRARIARRRKRMIAAVGRQLDAGIADRLQHAINTQMNGIVGMLEMMQQTELTDDQRAMLDVAQGTAENLFSESGRLLRWNVKDHAESNATFPSDALTALRILLVDADIDSQSTIRQALDSHGAAIDCFTTPAAALNALTKAATAGDPYQIVILDQQLQGVDGETFGHAISNDPAHRDTLLVLISNDHGTQDADRLAQSGFSAWLPKPPRLSMLVDTLSMLSGWIADKEAPRFISAGILVDDHAASASFLPFDGRRILAVDDNRVNLQVVERMLARMGCHVDTVSGGEQALAMAAQQDYDLILMDCQMPKLDGYQTTALLRAAENGTRHTPIIGWSARAGRKERDTCLAIGMDDFIAKPVRLQALNTLLAKWLPPSNNDKAAMASVEPDDELAVTQQMFGDDFAELAQLFLADTPPRIAALQKAAIESDAATFAKVAHALCGSSASIGAGALAAICRDLEIRARGGSIGNALRMQSVEKEYARIDARLHAMLQAAGTGQTHPQSDHL